jgi:hypothetical protein
VTVLTVTVGDHRAFVLSSLLLVAASEAAALQDTQGKDGGLVLQ